MISLAAAFALTGVICSISGWLVYFRTRDASSALCDHLIIGGFSLSIIGLTLILSKIPHAANSLYG